MNFLKKILGNTGDEIRIPDELKESSKKMGERLAYLISILFSPDEQANVLTLIEKMAPEELFNYYQALEKRFQEFAIAHDQQLDTTYDQNIQEIKENHKLESEVIEADFNNALSNLEDKISKK